MFNKSQITSYQNITAPADLKERVLIACKNTKEVNAFVPSKTILRLTPLVACLVLCFTLFFPSFQSDNQPFYLKAGETEISFYSVQLPPPVQESTPMVRTISLEPASYTVHLQTSPNVRIVSADGDAVIDEVGNLTWSILVPMDDAIFTLTLQAGGDTYSVPLTYHSQDGNFSICCLAN